MDFGTRDVLAWLDEPESAPAELCAFVAAARAFAAAPQGEWPTALGAAPEPLGLAWIDALGVQGHATALARLKDVAPRKAWRKQAGRRLHALTGRGLALATPPRPPATGRVATVVGEAPPSFVAWPDSQGKAPVFFAAADLEHGVWGLLVTLRDDGGADDWELFEPLSRKQTERLRRGFGGVADLPLDTVPAAFAKALIADVLRRLDAAGRPPLGAARWRDAFSDAAPLVEPPAALPPGALMQSRAFATTPGPRLWVVVSREFERIQQRVAQAFASPLVHTPEARLDYGRIEIERALTEIFDAARRAALAWRFRLLARLWTTLGRTAEAAPAWAAAAGMADPACDINAQPFMQGFVESVLEALADAQVAADEEPADGDDDAGYDAPDADDTAEPGERRSPSGLYLP